jgi:hypothetical protein
LSQNGGRIKQGGRKEKNFGSETGSNIRMKLSKGIDVLIKHNVMRDINATFSDIQTLEPFVHIAIT